MTRILLGKPFAAQGKQDTRLRSFSSFKMSRHLRRCGHGRSNAARPYKAAILSAQTEAYVTKKEYSASAVGEGRAEFAAGLNDAENAFAGDHPDDVGGAVVGL